MNNLNERYGLGIDFGTSGARSIVIDAQGIVLDEQVLSFNKTKCRQFSAWSSILFELMSGIVAPLRSQITHIAINGTSSTVLVCDEQGQPVLPSMMYDDMGDRTFLNILTPVVPAGHCVLSASSSLVKLLTFQSQQEFKRAKFLLHQADWLAFLLHGQLGVSDYHNSLKLGYAPGSEAYPDWFKEPVFGTVRSLLPKVLPPGTAIGPVLPNIATLLGLPPHCQVCAGTTDSIAAFLASQSTQPGEAVTSLGSTLVLKLLSQKRIDHSEYGIYSHRLGSMWLVGGASNTGGAVLAHFFSAQELDQLSQHIDPSQESFLDYYPLLKVGERFPINDPDLQPRVEPRPENSVAFLHGLLESLSRIEAQGYKRLQQLGASSLNRVATAGGGAKNQVWQIIRQRHLNVPVMRSAQEQAAYGTARLALWGSHYPNGKWS